MISLLIKLKDWLHMFLTVTITCKAKYHSNLLLHSFLKLLIILGNIVVFVVVMGCCSCLDYIIIQWLEGFKKDTTMCSGFESLNFGVMAEQAFLRACPYSFNVGSSNKALYIMLIFLVSFTVSSSSSSSAPWFAVCKIISMILITSLSFNSLPNSEEMVL